MTILLSLIMMEYITHTILMNCITPMSNCIPTLQWPYYYHIEQWPPGHATWTEEELQRVFQGTERLRAEREEVLDPTVSGWWGRGTPCWLGKNLHFMPYFCRILTYFDHENNGIYEWYTWISLINAGRCHDFACEIRISQNYEEYHW